MRKTLSVFLVFFASGIGLAQDKKAPVPAGLEIEKAISDSSRTKILFIGGSSFYKPGEHEYLKGSATLLQLVEQQPGVRGVVAIDWPKKEETWENTKAIVFFFDGAEKHQAIQKARLEKVRQLAAKGVGIVQLHQTADYPKEVSTSALDWAGGVWEKGMGKRAHWVQRFSDFPDHPIFHGVEPFQIDDGWLWNIRFAPRKAGVTPLLRAVQPKSKDDIKKDGAIIAWAYERPGGGRSVTFTGGHLQKSFDEEGYRRFLTNAVLWSAGVEIPKEGAKVDWKEKAGPK